MEDYKVKQTIELQPITEQFIKALNLIKEGTTIFDMAIDEKYGKDKDKGDGCEWCPPPPPPPKKRRGPFF